MEILIGFLLGTIGLQLLDTIQNLLSTWTQKKCSNMSISIVENNQKIAEIQNSMENNETSTIGFVMPAMKEDEEEYCYE